MNHLSILKAEEGIALIAAIFMIVVFGFIGISIVSLVGTQGFSAMNEVKSDQAFFIATGGMEQARYLFETGTPCAGLTNAVPTALGAGSFTTVGTAYNPVSTLVNQAGGINNSAATIPVDSIAGYAPHGRIRIDAESIDYAGSSTDPLVCGAPACFTGAERGAGGTTAAAHANNAPVTQNQCLIRSIGTVAGPLGNSQRVVEVGLVNSGPSVQTGESTISGVNPTLNIPLATPVDPAKAFLIFNTRHNHNAPSGSMLRGRILDATTLQFQQATNANRPMTIRWYVVEYPSGVNVQRGSVNQVDSIPGGQVQTNVTLPTPVASLNQAFVTWSKTADPAHTTWDDNDPILGELINTATLQFRSTAPADPTHAIWWQVIEFTNPADIFVQKGTIGPVAMNQGGPTTQTVTATLPTAVDMSKTFVLVGYRTSGGGDGDVGARMLRAQLTGPTSVTIDRATRRNSRIQEITWQAIELLDGSFVQGGSQNFPNGDPQQIANLATPVDITRSVAFASVQPAAGQSMGRSPYGPGGNNDYVGVGSVTMALSPAGDQVTMDRSNTNSSADIGWFAVQFGSGGGGQSRIDWMESFR